jgi:hypothetical protein
MEHKATIEKGRYIWFLVMLTTTAIGVTLHIMDTPMGVSFLKHSLTNFVVSCQIWKVSTWYHGK